MKKNRLPAIKKDIKKFLTSEEGRVNKKDITKIALGILTLGIGIHGVGGSHKADASCSHGVWGSY